MLMRQRVEAQARAYLTTQTPNIELTTAEMISSLVRTRALDDATDKLLYKLVSSLASYELADCCHRGVPRQGKGPMRNKMIRPWIWHSPRERHNEALPLRATCSHCGQLMPEDGAL